MIRVLFRVLQSVGQGSFQFGNTCIHFALSITGSTTIHNWEFAIIIALITQNDNLLPRVSADTSSGAEVASLIAIPHTDDASCAHFTFVSGQVLNTTIINAHGTRVELAVPMEIQSILGQIINDASGN